jgi:hypothetical protein
MSGPAVGDRMTPERPAAERGADLRVARLHVRGGAYALARAELEALAGSDGLDRDGILDLAEVRWRTGDLAGAFVAAAAWLEDGADGGAPGALAHVICAEAAAARGALEVAGAHVEAAAPGLGDRATLDAILAGIAARAVWPWEPEIPPAPSAAVPEPPAMAPVPVPVVGEVASGQPPAQAAAVAPAAAQLARAGAALVGDAPERAVVLLALALRADRAAAEAVLAALDAAEPGPAHAPAFAFVRGEALRAAGRHEESRIAYAVAESLALEPAEPGTPRSPQ